jgi:hypothetical protein
MTLDENEKVLEEKRKSLYALKTEGRKVDSKALFVSWILEGEGGGKIFFLPLHLTLHPYK